MTLRFEDCDMNLTEKILATVKSNPGITSVEVYNQLDEAQGKNDVSSILASLYKYGRVTREPAVINKRNTFRYTVRDEEQGTPAPAREVSRIDVIGQNGNDGLHYDSIQQESGSQTHAELNSRIVELEQMVARSNEAITRLTKQRDSWQDTATQLSGRITLQPASVIAPPLFWLAIASHDHPPVSCVTEEDARREAELLALQEGEAYVCAVLAECKTIVTWKEAA